MLSKRRMRAFFCVRLARTGVLCILHKNYQPQAGLHFISLKQVSVLKEMSEILGDI